MREPQKSREEHHCGMHYKLSVIKQHKNKIWKRLLLHNSFNR